MAWAVKYRIEWDDISGVDWKVDIEEDSFAGSITTLKATGNPLNIFWDNYNDNIFDPLKPSEANLEVFSETNFAIADIYAIQDLQFRMSVYENEVLKWRGFINSRKYEEPYECPPYPVTINAICGLEFLRDYFYASSVSISDGVQDITYYNGFRTEAQIITDILGKIGVTGFTEYINIYENSMNSATSDSPMDQTAINVDVFRGFYCDEVLMQILSKYNACIIQKDGSFVIYRPTELGGANVAGRVFTSATAKTSTTLHPEQYINRSTHPTNRVQVENGRMMILRPASQINLYQNYKFRESWLDNYNFSPDAWGGSFLLGYTAENWTAVSSPGLSSVSYRIPTEKMGALLMNHNTYPTLSKYIYQEFGELAEVCDDEIFGFSFDYQWVNEQGSAAAGQTFYFSVSIEAGANDYYLQKTVDSEVLCEWTASGSPLYIDITEDIPQGNSGWANWSRRFVSIPSAGPIKISLFCLNDAGALIYFAVKNIRFYGSSDLMTNKLVTRDVPNGEWWNWLIYPQLDQIFSTTHKFPHRVYNIEDNPEIVENTYIVSNNINGEIREYRYILGDVVDSGITNILEQFNGALAVLLPGAINDAVAAFDTDHSADYAPGGVEVTHSGNTIILTSDTAGVDFTGETSITNKTGTLTGLAVTMVPNSAARGQIDDVEILSGTTFSSIDVTVKGVTRRCTWDTDKATTASKFVISANITAYAAVGITLALSDSFEGFTFSGVGGDVFTTSVVEFSPAFTWSLDTVQTAADAVARVDYIIISGTWGTADILCDGVTEEISISVGLTPSGVWNTRGGSEAKELLKIIGDEIAAQYARPKQLIQMPIQETGTGVSQIDVVGSFQDDLNTYSGSNRKFVFNRGKWDTKMRRWEIDLCEIL